jgi:hypothetical protein
MTPIAWPGLSLPKNWKTLTPVYLGHVIEPVIKPLGFDWKIGIALITSFAAREVFVGTMATIYSVEGDADKIESVQDKMRNAKNPNTGQPGVYPCRGLFADDVLRLCHAMRQYRGRSIPRNQRLALARRPICLYDRAGLWGRVFSLPL